MFEETLHGEEEDILKRFVKAVSDYDPDIITGYNIDGIPNYSLGYVNIIIVLSISITSIFTAPIGAKLSTKFNNKALKKIFAVFLLMTCISLFINHFF